MRVVSNNLFSKLFSNVFGNPSRRAYGRWLIRRNPPQHRQCLNRKTIFIFPSSVGFAFLATVMLLWLLGTNYQNNLILVLSFLLLSLLHTCIFYTYHNLSGLDIESINTPPSFVGDTAQVTLRLHNPHSRYIHQLHIGWVSDRGLTTVDVPPRSTQTVSIPLPLSSRGWHRAERVRLSTVYPLGLIKAWSRLDLAIDVLAYPQRVDAKLPESSVKPSDKQENQEEVSTVLLHNEAIDHSEDFSHLRDYQEGDSLKHIAWKHYAKGQGLATKVYESDDHIERQQWIDWDDFSGFSLEGRLSRLTDCIVQAEQAQLIYGLILPNGVSELSTGEAHQHQLLERLALFDHKGGSQDNE